MELGEKYITRNRAILVITICFFLIVIFWLSQHSFIDIKINGAGRDINYTIINQGGGSKKKFSSHDSHVRKMVSRGSYLVEAKTASGSFVQPVVTKSFLRTVYVSGSAVPERLREFVGSNPDPCMYYTGEILYSFACSGFENDIKVHVPATSDSPTVVQPLIKGSLVDGAGLVNFDGRDYLAVKVPDLESSKPVVLYPLVFPFSMSGGVGLRSLDAKNSYQVEQFGTGLIAYDRAYSKVVVYDSAAKQTKKLSLISLDNKFEPASLSTDGTKIAIKYVSGVEKNNLDEESNNQGETKVVVYSKGSGKPTPYSFGGIYLEARLCGNTSLCMLKGRELTVYDISSDKAKKQFSVPEVQNTIIEGKSVVYATPHEIVRLDLDKIHGSIDYSFGDYKFCGFGKSATPGYIACVIDLQGNRYALYINTEQPNINNIDKKVAELLNSVSVDTVSPYKKYIYVNPELGSLSYNPGVKGFTYDKAVVQKSNSAINKDVDRLDLKKSGFVVINPYSNY